MGDILEFYFYAFLFFSTTLLIKSVIILWFTNAFLKEKVPVNLKTATAVSLALVLIGGKR